MKSQQTQDNPSITEEKFVFHEDAAHGWLEVPYSIIEQLQIIDKITGYSYRHHDQVFLEEDQDMTTFTNAYLQHLSREGKDYAYLRSIMIPVYDGESSPIRNYPSYTPDHSS
ncbi:MAG: hypothetical protein J0I32_09485 [Sphingobacteriales bacterium]|nr:hypothetical protein [Sphingobacteriales bacterium]OJW00230.1 MAG: hypothetical protein BGO52_03855 [Sphingobacteriales bacterium 44-61]